MRTPLLFVLLLSSASTVVAHAEEAPTVALAQVFDSEANKVFRVSAEKKKGIELVVQGQRIGGYVVAIGSDSVILASREHGTMVVKRASIDAVIAD
jgi:hypothetical protein